MNGRVAPGIDDYTADYANILAMLFSMLGLMMKVNFVYEVYNEKM